MKTKDFKPREPTNAKVSSVSKTSKAQKKKLYRKRTMEEVRRGIHFVENSYDNGEPENQDPAHKTVDAAVDTARSTGDLVKGRISSYSNKLKSERIETGTKKSDKLMSVTQKTETARSKALKSEAEMSKSVGKELQKKKIKREYAKAARDAGNAVKSGKAAGGIGKKATEKGKDAVGAALKQIGKLVSEHPLGCALVVLIGIVVLAVISCVGSIGLLFGGPNNGSMIGGTFTAKDSDIYAVENAYMAKENALQTQINSIQSTYNGYDEYNYYLDSIGHDPYQLAAYLTIQYDDYDLRGVSSELTSLFDAQYSLTITPVTETRYKWEERTGYILVYDYDEKGYQTGYHFEPYTYYVQVEYSYYILNVSLTNRGLDSVNRTKLPEEEIYRYDALLALKGGKPDLW